MQKILLINNLPFRGTDCKHESFTRVTRARRLCRVPRMSCEELTWTSHDLHIRRSESAAASNCGRNSSEVAFMRRSTIICGLAIAGAAAAFVAHAKADGPKDFGLFVAEQLRAHSEELFGFRHPLRHSVPGPFDGTDNTQAIVVADGLSVSLVSSSVASAADQIAFWPNDDHPTHVFVCDEETSNPAVQRVDLSKPAASNATTIVTGLLSCDPVRRTPWGTIIVAEEHGADGGLYEILDPLSISAPINVSDRAAGTNATYDPSLVKLKAVGALS